MRILITGSSGHLGHALVSEFGRLGHDVVGMDVLSAPTTTVTGSVTERAAVRRALEGVNAVIHAATLHKPHVATPHRADSPKMSGPQTAPAQATLAASPSNFLECPCRKARSRLRALLRPASTMRKVSACSASRARAPTGIVARHARMMVSPRALPASPPTTAGSRTCRTSRAALRSTCSHIRSLATRAVVSTAGGVEPVWSPDGRKLYFRSAENLMVADVAATAPIAFDRPRTLFADRFTRTQGLMHTHYAAAREGRLLMIESPTAETGTRALGRRFRSCSTGPRPCSAWRRGDENAPSS